MSFFVFAQFSPKIGILSFQIFQNKSYTECTVWKSTYWKTQSQFSSNWTFPLKKLLKSGFILIVSNIFHSQCGKTSNSLSLQKKIREINSFVSSLVKTLLSRNFCQESVRVISAISTRWFEIWECHSDAHFSVLRKKS